MYGLLSALRIVALVFFGVLLSWKDVKYRKIFNRDLLLVFSFGLLLSLAEFGVALPYNFFVNIFLSALAGFLLWKMRFWSAGDGKLLVAYSAFLPPPVYESFFPSQYILYNIFLLSFFVWLPSLLLKTKGSEKLEVLKKAFGLESIARMALGIFGLFWAVGLAASYLGLDGYMAYLILALVLFYVIRQAFPEKSVYVLAVLSAGRFVFDYSVYTWAFALTFALTLAGLLIALAFGYLGTYVSYNLKPLGSVGEGDVPFGIMAKATPGKSADFRRLMEKQFGSSAIRIMESGFGKKDLQKVKLLKGKINGFMVKQNIAFVPLFFVATLLTVLIGKDVFLYAVAGLYSLIYE